MFKEIWEAIVKPLWSLVVAVSLNFIVMGAAYWILTGRHLFA